MAANAENVILKLLENDGVDRPLTFEELDGNFKELINIIEEHQTYAVKHNVDATTEPTSDDDETQDYEPRSLWFDTSGDTPEIWQCVDATEGQASWIKISFTVDEQKASETSYDNTDSGLDATDVKSAIDEVDVNHEDHLADSDDPHDSQAFQVDYDNTDSGLDAVDVQAAIDEVDSDLDSHKSADDPHPQYTTDDEATVIAQDQAVVFAIALG